MMTSVATDEIGLLIGDGIHALVIPHARPSQKIACCATARWATPPVGRRRRASRRRVSAPSVRSLLTAYQARPLGKLSQLDERNRQPGLIGG